MDCQKVGDMLHAVLDGEVSCDELEFFNQHLDNCSNCNGHVDKEKQLFKEIKTKLESRSCPQGLLDKVLSKIDELSK